MGDQLVVAVMVLVIVQVFLFWGIAKRLDRHDQIQAGIRRELTYLTLVQAETMRRGAWVSGVATVSIPIRESLRGDAHP